jgi:hypothetical protein
MFQMRECKTFNCIKPKFNKAYVFHPIIVISETSFFKYINYLMYLKSEILFITVTRIFHFHMPARPTRIV